jgi:TolB-like protein/Tfp pilus assembly protein PilF
LNSDPPENPIHPAELGWLARLRRRGVLRVAFSYALIAWLLLQIGSVVLGPLGAPGWMMRALIVVVAAGFPVALLLAWFFELTPTGIERDTLPEGVARPRVLGIRHYADALVIGVLLVTVAFLLARQEGWVDEEQGPPIIAVLPFTELGAADDRYFGAGLADTLIHKLGELSQLVVLASSSTSEFRGSGLDLRTVGDTLGASSILEGTVQRAGNQLRINARLVEVESGQQLWSGSFERQSTDLFAVQDEIAGAVTTALQVVLSPSEEGRLAAASTLNLTAYDAYLLGQSKLAERRRETIDESIQYFRQAIEIDPSYALAYTGLAEAIYLTASYRWWETDWKVQGPEAHRAAATAQSLDPQLGEAYLAQAFAAMGDNEWGDGSTWPNVHIAALLKRAVELSPNSANALKSYSEYVESPDEAMELMQRAARLDPRSGIIRMNIGEQYLKRGEVDVAVTWMLKAATAGDKAFLTAYREISEIYFYDTGEFDEAARWGRALWRAHPEDWNAYTAYLRPLLELGAWDDADAVVQAMPVETSNPPLPGVLYVRLSIGAHLAAAQGDIDQAEELANTFSQTFYESLPTWPDLSNAPATTMLDIMALADINRGQPQVALERYRVALPDPNNWEFWNRGAGPLPTPALLAVLHRQTGDAETGDRILRDFLVRTAAQPTKGDEGTGFTRFISHAFLGETDAAIAALEDAVKIGHLQGWWGLKTGAFDPNYAAVLSDPRFVKLYAEIENRVRKMRENFLAHPELPEGMEVK